MLVANRCGVATAWLTSVNYEISWYISLLLDNAYVDGALFIIGSPSTL